MPLQPAHFITRREGRYEGRIEPAPMLESSLSDSRRIVSIKLLEHFLLVPLV